MVAKLFNIKRCIIDVNHQIIRHNHEVHVSGSSMKKLNAFASILTSCFKDVDKGDSPISKNDTNADPNKSRRGSTSDEDEKEKTPDEDGEEHTSDDDAKKNRSHTTVENVNETKRHRWVSKVDVGDSRKQSGNVPSSSSQSSKKTRSTENETVKEIDRSHPAHSEHEREVLNVYGKFLTLNRKRNTLVILIITVTVISAVIIAGFEGCFMANITVYADGPCPYYGAMDCYYGSSGTYFNCTPDISITLPASIKSATCFRWIGRDITVSDVMTQVGACTGLLTALGSVLEVFIRLLYFVFQQRLGVATGIRRVMEKTVGINKFTQPRYCGCCMLPCRFGTLNLRLYQHPFLVIFAFYAYAALPVIVIVSIVLMTKFQISVTSLTYIIMITVVLISCMGLLWILWEEDEIDLVIPGAWNDINDTFDSMKIPFSKLSPAIESIIPTKDMKRLKTFFDNQLKTAHSHIELTLKQLNKYTDDVLKATEHFENRLPVEKREQFKNRREHIRSENKNLHGAAEKIRLKQEAEKEKDIKNRKT
ncbi:unnamed protein product [Adineta steineri]|uniref:Uncharacterized protein n=1 Tax=Adineta steineri TaxID=433720 RepID=A0A814YGC2_9BILA|nr:unnamed protein product [Adineta steineri]CAF3663713.1 unnamed protein product [Adineta steineri]